MRSYWWLGFRWLAYQWLALVCCSLAAAACCQTLCCQAWGAQAAPVEEEAPHGKKAAAVKEKPPLHHPPALQPKKILPPGQLFVHQRAAKAPVQQDQQPVDEKAAQPAPAKKPSLPAHRQPNGLFWSPRQSQFPLGNLSRASVYHLESLGRHVQLTPAMRWHLNRSGVAVNPAGPPLPAVVTAPARGAEKFYPGVSRLPTKKPFADIERPATGLQRYWPLLLEGREDPHTGLIIWSLP